MEINILNQHTTEKEKWADIQQQITTFKWGGAQLTAKKMAGTMGINERVIVAIDHKKVVGIGSLVRQDIADLPQTPFISAIYVDPDYREKHLGTQIVKAAQSTAKQLGFKDVYVISGLDNYYEKMGFNYQGDVTDFMGRKMKLYHKNI
ncbi:GNAT family N-acetyltransferase [Lentilactobacillus hilgardii]|uniref:GNAT family N-acetyltransferase n=1 Tax=Lentilactobacillus hilgardii TaxID=1588 RepID=UPI0021C2C8A4|nr:GNAT family N-acetyltransferase [Lentilactobacillus hilgardii]MCP9333681.1 GNAT family N-acetyltransferase [Lentilactobacillus hilgardii]MCP9350275.1 GNAT family N-acetyltransferase [Lentilactobacillus hilgardii]MCP9353151.1 GNAT family N-acetyltransferase [Lentilactobacillus hilgardii]